MNTQTPSITIDLTNWDIDKYTATSPDGTEVLWIANSFLFFRDYERGYLLSSLTRKEKKKLWKDIQTEKRHRIISMYCK